MRIGELALRSGVSEKTLRYYEDIGLVDTPERSANGYRDYGADVVDRLRFVRSAQAVGLTLAEIREILGLRERGETPCQHVLAVIEKHAEEIDARIKELRDLRRELKELALNGQQLDPRDCSPEDVCHVIPPASLARQRGRRQALPRTRRTSAR